MYAATSARSAAASICLAPSRTISSSSDRAAALSPGCGSSWTTLSTGVPSRTSAPTPVLIRTASDSRSSSGRCAPSRHPAGGPSTGSDHCSAVTTAGTRRRSVAAAHARLCRIGWPQGCSAAMSGEDVTAMVRHAVPHELLKGEGGPAGERHAADVEEQLDGAAPDLLTCHERDAEGDVPGGGDGGDGDEHSGKSADLGRRQGQHPGGGGDERDDEGPLVW